MIEVLLVALLALGLGLLAGWLFAGRRSGALARDLAVAQARAADADLIRQTRDAVERERNAALQDVASLRAQATERQAAHEDAVRQLHQSRDALQDLASLRAQSEERQAAHEEALRQLHHARTAMQDLASLRAQSEERQAAHAETLRQLTEFKEAMNTQFGAAATRALEAAQTRFLERAQQRFAESEQVQGQRLAALLQPVHERLQRYEENVTKVEAERRDAFGNLAGLMESMRVGQDSVRSEAAKLVNALRNAPKARGRWGEQQLRNVLESCGLAEHTDFAMEVSVSDGEGGRLRPDAIVRVPGGKSLIIDAKVSLNAYQDAFGAVDDAERHVGLAAHAQSMRTHINGLGNKAYWAQFQDTPEYVVMFVPGEHFLSAALEHDPTLWDFAFDKRVLLATPTNLIAIARTVSAVWRQEKLASEARAIGNLGKELYDRLAKASEDLRKVGSGLTSAVNNYNSFVSSFESRALVSARKLRDYNIEPGARDLAVVEPVEALARYGAEAPRIGGSGGKDDAE